MAVAVLAASVGLTAFLGTRYSGQAQAGMFDAAIDEWAQRVLGGHRTADVLVYLGSPVPVSVMTGGLLVASLVIRQWRGAVLVAVAVPGAVAMTELVLKPLVHRTLTGQLSFPSGHATAVSALAVAFTVLLVDPPRPRIAGKFRLVLALCALAAAGAVAIAIVAAEAHYATDTLGAAAVATAVVLLTALVLDRLPLRR